MKGETYKLNIFMVVPGMLFDGDTIKQRSLGGSETAGLCMGRELAKLGHEVTVMANLPGKEGVIDGVSYISIQRAEEIVQKAPHDVLIVQREPRWFGLNTASKINVLWNHDLAIKAFLPTHQAAAWNIDWVFLLSQFHVEQVKSIYSFFDDDHIRLTRNGIDPENFPNMQKIPKKVIYAARPERGLANLVNPGGIMERLYQADPKIHLYVAGYDNTVQEMAQLYNYLWGRCNELPNVTLLGHLTQKEMHRHEAEAELYLYPTDFEEISCITAMECMQCGTPFVTTRKAALPETLGEKTSVLLDGPTTGRGYTDQFITETLNLLNDKDRRRKLRDRRRKLSFQCRERAKGFSWSGVAQQWEGLFYDRFRKATEDKRKLIRHFLHHDDVMAALKIEYGDSVDEASGRAIDDYWWALDEKSHREYYENFSNKEFEKYPPQKVFIHYDNQFPREPRWDAIKVWFTENEIKQGAKVLDVGCGCGYFSVGMANEFDVRVTGIDVSDKYIIEAIRLAEDRQKKGDCTFFLDEDLGWQNDGPFDVVVISEVLEHVGYMETAEFVKQYEEYLKPDGRFLVTTPFGPSRKEARKRGEEHHNLHVRHFDRADIEDVFGKKNDYKLEIIYWKQAKYTNELLGWYMYSFGTSGDYGEIDFDRKTALQIPRDTLSVCIIAKNEEAIIRRCLKSVEEIADEIVFVDTGSVDRTKELAAEFGAKVFNGSDPLVSGFETPRNESIEQATGDWILWIDADEELQGAENLPKYLRESVYKGFRIRQHHFSCQPPGASVIDKPVRLFRRRDEVKFFGLIHEHPGVNPNDGVGEVIEVADVDIAHSGYHSETERRKKFWRNLPMMMRDIEKYPERILGRFLYMRDQMHLVHWSAEQTGRITDEARLRCHEVIQIYRNSFLPMGGHMMTDGLQYYQAALKTLGMGFEFSWSVNVNNGAQPEQLRAARFADREDFSVFIGKMLEEKACLFEGDYVR